MRRTLALLTVTVSALAASAALGALPQQGGTVDLRSQVDGKVKSNSAAEGLAGTVAGVGDFNGDGLGDMALGVLEGGGAQSARVVFGVNAPFEAQLNDDKLVAGAGGGVALVSSRPVTALAGAGDVNGDGRADLVLGSCLRASGDAGRAWIVFGRPGGAAINLDALGAGGFQVDGASGQCLGSAVDGAGDANGDGRPDVVIGTVEAGGGSGGAVVVFGKQDPATVNAGALGTGGYSMAAPGAGDGAGQYVAGLGDVNGDGRGDVGVGAATHDPAIGADAGSVWVVFGRVTAAATNIALGQIGPSDDVNGFRIDGPDPGALLGPVAQAGDVNGDGKADVAVGAPGDDRAAVGGGSVSVVFGKASANEVQSAALNDFGYQFRNAVAEDAFGASLRGGLDVDGDGVPDLAAGAPQSDPNTLTSAGTVYVLDGRTSVSAGAADDALAPADPANGFRISGPRGSSAGQAPSALGSPGAIGLGDVNGDGRTDVLSGVGSGPVSGGTTDPGNAYVTLGFGQPAFRVPATYSFTAGAPAVPVLPSDVRRTGSATFSISPALPPGLVLDPATGAVSGTPAEEMPARQFTLKLTDLAGEAARGPRIVIGPGPDVKPPVISRARLRHRKFRVSARPTALKSARRKRAPFGTQLRMNLSEAVTLKLTLACARPVRGARKSFCKKKITARRATFTRSVGRGGDTVFTFTGRIGRRTKLLPGRYTFTVVATDSVKLVSKPVRVRFEVVK